MLIKVIGLLHIVCRIMFLSDVVIPRSNRKLSCSLTRTIYKTKLPRSPMDSSPIKVKLTNSLATRLAKPGTLKAEL